MKVTRAHAMAISLAAHLGLLCALARWYLPGVAAPEAPPVVAVRLSAVAGPLSLWTPPEGPREERQAEARLTWAPAAASTPARRIEAGRPGAERQPGRAARSGLQPRAERGAQPHARLAAAEHLPAIAAVSHAGGAFAAPHLSVDEEVGARLGLGPPGGASGAGDGAAAAGNGSRLAGTGASGSGTPGTGTGGNGDGTSRSGRAGPGGDGDGGGTGASLVAITKPSYPRQSRLDGEEGTVLIDVEIRADGMPGRIEVAASSGHPRLDEAGLNALRKATFAPATRGGKRVASVKRFAFTFRLEDPEG